MTIKETVDRHLSDLRSLQYVLARPEFDSSYQENPDRVTYLVRIASFHPDSGERTHALNNLRQFMRTEESLSELRIAAGQLGIARYSRMCKEELNVVVNTARKTFTENRERDLQNRLADTNESTDSGHQAVADCVQGRQDRFCGSGRSGAD